jgi:PBP4 family serine-type D-alanyl-D-alanine carboxypeptidase
VRSGEELYELNSEKLFRPASNIKLFTAAAALALLGGDFEFKTEVFVVEQPGKRRPSLILKGHGDPLLTENDLDSLAAQVSASGIRDVEDLIADVSYFDNVCWGRGWMWDDDPGGDWPYISPLSVDRNVLKLIVAPGKSPGRSADVRFQRPVSSVCLTARVLTASDTTRSSLRMYRRWDGQNDTIVLEGVVPTAERPKLIEVTVRRPEMQALALFKEKLAIHGVSVAGTLRVEPEGGGHRIAFVAHRLDSVAVVLNRESYNLAAENVLKTLAAQRLGQPGTAAGGITLLKQYLQSMGIDTTALTLADGSGVSRYNLAAPSQIIQLLLAAQRDSSLRDTFIRSLPMAGMNGTLKNRMANGQAFGNARAKTGTHTDAVALSGYVTDAGGELLAFSIMFNHFVGNVPGYRTLQDRIVEILANCK